MHSHLHITHNSSITHVWKRCLSRARGCQQCPAGSSEEAASIWPGLPHAAPGAPASSRLWQDAFLPAQRASSRQTPWSAFKQAAQRANSLRSTEGSFAEQPESCRFCGGSQAPLLGFLRKRQVRAGTFPQYFWQLFNILLVKLGSHTCPKHCFKGIVTASS